MKQKIKDKIQVWLMTSGMFLIGFALGLILALEILK